jgi:hypothetical protein
VDGYFATPTVVARAPSRPRTSRPLVAALLVVLVLVVATAIVTTTRAVRAADLGALIALGEPAAAADGWGPSWVDEQGRPARWDPCTPIPYVVQAGWMPHDGRRDLAEALRRLSQVSGLRFVDEGDTDELPVRDRRAYQPDRYGERWAPLLVAWVPASVTDVGIGGDVQGVNLGVAVPGRDGPSIVTGQVVLDADHRLAPGFGAGTTEGEVLLHELTHAVGLRHVLDATQLMYPTTTNAESAFGAGDRAGLAAVGAAAGCHRAPEPRPLELQP